MFANLRESFHVKFVNLPKKPSCQAPPSVPVPSALIKKKQKNLEAIVFLPIFATNMRRNEITKSIKEALKSVPYKMEARLYGSEARGDTRPDSDIDLLILVDQPTVTGKDEDTIFAPLYQVELQSGVLINPLIIPKSQWGANVSPFYINVENEGVPL